MRQRTYGGVGSPAREGGLTRFGCARHGAHLGGVSPLLAPSMGIMSLCKGVYREVESEGSKWRSLVVTNRNHIVGYYIG